MWHASNSEGSEECMGRLVTRAKKSGVVNIKFFDFGLFCETVYNELQPDSICEEIGFKWNQAANMEDELIKLMDRMGWSKKELPEPDSDIDYDMKIVKLYPEEMTDVHTSLGE